MKLGSIHRKIDHCLHQIEKRRQDFLLSGDREDQAWDDFASDKEVNFWYEMADRLLPK